MRGALQTVIRVRLFKWIGGYIFLAIRLPNSLLCSSCFPVPCLVLFFVLSYSSLLGSRPGAVAKLDDRCGSSLLFLYSAPRRFSPGVGIVEVKSAELLELNKYKYKYAKYQPRSQGLHCR